MVLIKRFIILCFAFACVNTFAQTNRIHKVNIPISQNHIYEINGYINSHKAHFIVDTGASYVTLNHLIANKIGLDYKRFGKELIVNTASGKTDAYLLKINAIHIGSIFLQNIDAIVVLNPKLEGVLLGISALRQLQLIQKNEVLTLIQVRR